MQGFRAQGLAADMMAVFLFRSATGLLMAFEPYLGKLYLSLLDRPWFKIEPIQSLCEDGACHYQELLPTFQAPRPNVPDVYHHAEEVSSLSADSNSMHLFPFACAKEADEVEDWIVQESEDC